MVWICSYFCTTIHFNNLFSHRLRKSHCIRPSSCQAIANSALGSRRLATPAAYNNTVVLFKMKANDIVSDSTTLNHQIPGWKWLWRKKHWAARNSYFCWKTKTAPKGLICLSIRNKEKRVEVCLGSLQHCKGNAQGSRHNCKSLDDHFTKTFWQNISKKAMLPSTVWGGIGNEAVATLQKKHFEALLNLSCNKNTCCTS